MSISYMPIRLQFGRAPSLVSIPCTRVEHSFVENEWEHARCSCWNANLPKRFLRDVAYLFATAPFTAVVYVVQAPGLFVGVGPEWKCATSVAGVSAKFARSWTMLQEKQLLS